MNEEQIRDEARKAANRSQFKSNYIYDHKSYEDGFYEGMNQALLIAPVVGRSEQLKAFLLYIQENAPNYRTKQLKPDQVIKGYLESL